MVNGGKCVLLTAKSDEEREEEEEEERHNKHHTQTPLKSGGALLGGMDVMGKVGCWPIS